jgi:hypothetical protein
MNSSTLAGQSLRPAVASDSAQINLAIDRYIPGLVMEPSMMFAYPTCLVDVYRSAVEQIYLPELKYPSVTATIRVITGITHQRQPESLRRKASRSVSQVFRPQTSLDCSNQFIFDARWELDGHIGHIIDNVATALLYAQKVLSEHFDRQIQITVVLRKDASPLGRQAYETMGIPVIYTDNPVYGDVVTVETQDTLHSIQQDAFDFEFKGYNPNTPERVFIPRRGNRGLINNDEVVDFLERRGFTTYYFEDLTPSEEWSIARNAKAIVAVHGAACSNFIFNRPQSGLRLVEIFSPAFMLPGYRHIAPLMQGKWCGVRGQITPEMLQEIDFSHKPRNIQKAPISNPIRVSLGTLELALSYLDGV